MSIIERTKRYATELADSALNGFEKQARGDIAAPNGDENVKIYTAKGGSAVTLNSTTTSATVVFDPEASLRNGQLNVTVFERDSSGTVGYEQVVNLGRSTAEFISAGVLSSGLKVFNSSGVDVIGGTQTAAVLTSVARNVSTLDSTDVANSCANHERDMVSGVVSREDATMTMVLTEHFGKKMCLARSNTHANLVRRIWDDGVGTRSTTTGESLSHTSDTAMDAVGSSSRADSAIISGTTYHVLDTDLLSDANNPLTLATYMADFEVNAVMDAPTTTDTDYLVDLKALALDAAGNVLSSRKVRDVTNVTSGQQFILSGSGTLTSTTVPIARVIVAIDKNLTDQANLDFLASPSSSKVVAYEETADIAARPIHVCVLEGLNSSATLNLSSFAVLTGVPDSTNVFIASATPASDVVYDTNAVEIFLKSMSRALPRAFTVSGHSAVTKELTAMYGDEEMTVAFKAMSFDDVARRVKHAGSMAKKAFREIESMAQKSEPMMRNAGGVMSRMPGVVGDVGDALIVGADMMRSRRM
jgi:hypothetical protein